MATTVDTLLVRIESDMSDLKRDLKKIGNQTETTTNKMSSSFRKVGGALAALGGAAALGGLIKGFIQTGAEVENLGVRFNTLFGSVEEGSKAFQVMSGYASRVPFSLQDIQRGAAPLATVAKNADQLGQAMLLTGNIAAASGLSFDEAAGNIQRALTAGINSADQFRERGVSAMAGFQAGTSYSVEQTLDKLNEAFGAGGKYDGITDDLANTTDGALSMLSDSWFTFQRTVAESGLNESFRDLVNALKPLLESLKPLAVLIGKTLSGGFYLLASTVRVVTAQMDKLALATAAYIALKLGTTIFNTVRQMQTLAKVALINRNVFKSLNAIIRKNPLILLALGAAFAVEKLGGFEKVLKNLEEKFPRVFGGISDSASEFFNGMGEGMVDLNDLLRTPLSIDIRGDGASSGTKAAKKALSELQGIVDSNISPVHNLREEYHLLKNNMDKFSGPAKEKALEALDSLGQKINEQNPIISNLNSAVLSMSSGFSNAMADMLMSGKMNLNSLKDVFRSVVKVIIAKAIELFFVNKILNAVFGGFGGVPLPTASFPGLAGGGSVSPNQPYVVGERGPELFVPSSSGTVMNNSNSNGFGGGSTTVVNQTINVSAGVSQTVRAEMISLLPSFKQETMSGVADAKRRGGSYGRAFG
tara:strand:+ start:737 stop:2671 length:1935 start_codon:yes stop_codon:yes gene_type:complete